MRVFIKGGVWKNTEDEILKAAVMKYGKNMWARIASLLPRKSAKQVKARWYEWLDPSIKKTEWTREEEERLLHLAKLMPTQWRTIAPIVGRTAQQCLEHYEKLLDQAIAPEDRVDPSEDPRRLRPGEVDPHPETKPARPDPVDMDEDEKEMLSEARARLANTRGKKAKRKAREKQLEEARRLALLQKRRELKAAGISGRGRKKRRREIDYVSEIPFEKLAPSGFYDTSSDDTLMQRNRKDPAFLGKNLQQMEGMRRTEEERRARQRDKKRVKKLQQHNLPEAIMKQNALNDPGSFRKRSRLSMPAPQVSEEELEDIVKYGAAGAGGEGTSALLSQYGATPGATPMRTPRTPAGRNVIMEEARNHLALQKEQTPLKAGGERVDLVGGTGFGGVTPQHGVQATPNVLAAATPGRAGASATPMTARGGETPLRDELSINQDAESWAGGASQASTRAERARQKAMQAELAASLASLPAPEFELDIVVPDVDMEDDSGDAPLAPDASELDARAQAQRKAAMEAELRRRSSALQRVPPLPRPLEVNAAAFDNDDGSQASAPELAAANALVQREAKALLLRDAAKYPVTKSRRKRKAPRLESFTDDELVAAKEQVKNEAVNLQLLHEEELGTPVDGDVFGAVWETVHAELVFVPSRNANVSRDELTPAELVEAGQFDLARLVGFIGKLTKRATKLEAKVRVLTAGYEKRSGALNAALAEKFTEIDNSTLELACFKRLAQDETAAIPGRLGAAEAEARDVCERETELQARYANLVEEREKLLKQLQSITTKRA